MNTARRALVLLLASLPRIDMAAHHGPRQAAAAFATRAWHRSASTARSTAARQVQRGRQLRPQCYASFLDMVRRQCLAPMSTQQSTFSRGLSTRSIMQLFMASEDDDDGASETNAEERTSFNITVLKKETTRLTLRTLKKIGKASTRIRAAEEQYEKLRVAIDENSDEEMDDKLLQQLEQAPNVEQFKDELTELQSRLQKLNWLEKQFAKAPLKSKKHLSLEELQKLPEGAQVVEYVLELDISDDESQKQKRIEADARNRRSKKERQQQMKEEGITQVQGGRLPYRRYYTEQNVEIRVGKQATDNDVLSLSPEHRSGAHWWYHASGCAGSHVVLCTDDASPSKEDVRDAASLAALKSKCINQSVIKVSMTRARNVSKPRGAKPGLVQLNGEVKTITVKKSEVEERCKRLEETVIVN